MWRATRASRTCCRTRSASAGRMSRSSWDGSRADGRHGPAARSGHRRRARPRRRDRARCSRQAGHDVTFTYRSAEAEAEAMLGQLQAAHPQQKFAAHQADLADKAAVDALAATLEKEGPYSGFVHNAGQSYDTLAVMLDQDKAEAAMQVNFWSFTRLVDRAGAPDDARQGRPRRRRSARSRPSAATRAMPPMRPRRPPCSAMCARSRSRSRAATSR